MGVWSKFNQSLVFKLYCEKKKKLFSFFFLNKKINILFKFDLKLYDQTFAQDSNYKFGFIYYMAIYEFLIIELFIEIICFII